MMGIAVSLLKLFLFWLPKACLDTDMHRARLPNIIFDLSSWTVVLMQTAKDSAKHLIDTLPDTATTSDILRELYVRQKIELGLKASDEDRVTPQDQVFERFIKQNR